MSLAIYGVVKALNVYITRENGSPYSPMLRDHRTLMHDGMITTYVSDFDGTVTCVTIPVGEVGVQWTETQVVSPDSCASCMLDMEQHIRNARRDPNTTV